MGMHKKARKKGAAVGRSLCRLHLEENPDRCCKNEDVYKRQVPGCGTEGARPCAGIGVSGAAAAYLG